MNATTLTLCAARLSRMPEGTECVQRDGCEGKTAREQRWAKAGRLGNEWWQRRRREGGSHGTDLDDFEHLDMSPH